MRELIYLSEQKLQQFVTNKSLSWRGKVRMEGDIKIPGIGGVKIGPADPAQGKRTGPDVEKVIDALENSARAAAWFADKGARPGQWVYFEAPLSHIVIGGSVIFLDLGKPTDSYPTGGVVRLMLHGSRIHLTGSTSVEAIPMRAVGRSHFHLMMRDLDRYLTAEEEKFDTSTIPANEDESLPYRLNRVITTLDRSMQLELTAAWMAGYARVTAVVPSTPDVNLVVATPLYVEYIVEPKSID